MSNEGKKVKIHYTGTLSDGEKFDSSYDHGAPFEFVCMAGQVIPGFDDAVVNMSVGDKVKVTIPAAEAYGEYDESKVAKMQIDMMPGLTRLNVGDQVRMTTAQGIPMPGEVIHKDDESVTIDMNHPMAGKDLTFEIELLDVEE